MENNSVLVVKNLSVLIKERFLVKNASFSVDKGQCVGIIGEDKSGKTSLIKAIAGALPITDGSVVLDGENVCPGSPALKHISICLDPPVFFKFQTVLNNMQFLSGLSNNNDKEKIIKVLNKFNLAHKIKDKVKTLILIGKTADSIEEAVIKAGADSVEIIRCSTYEEVVNTAYNKATTGDVVLLSPASTSFDMFSNFEERGNLFKKLVNEL